MTNVPTDLLAGARSFVAFDSSARTATPNTVEFRNLNFDAAGLVVVIDATTVTATGSVTFDILGVDPVSGKTWTILTSAAITSTGTTVLRVHSNLTAAANTIAKDLLPPVIRLQATHANGVSVTYSVAGYLTA